MAAAKLLKISSNGVPQENATTDDITFGSYTVSGGPVLNANLDMNNGDINDVDFISFTDPTVDGITQTAGALAADNIMAKERGNTLTTAADILFPAIADSAGEVDAFRLPARAGVPSATPTNSGEGYLVWDSSNDRLYAWNGSAWTSAITTATSVPAVIDTADYVAISGGISARDVLYISAAGEVAAADANAEGTSRVIGFATAAAAGAAAASVQSDGVLSGFSSLTAGARYYLSETAGAITATAPTTSGASVVQVGYAASTTKVQILIQQLGIRA